jgi:uncharacterized membrane protein YeaQ/YmgE (transglycosylase-associated protein family)
VELFQLLLLGVAAGVVARLATHGRGRIGVRPGLVVGVVGAVAGGLLARAAGASQHTRWAVAVAAAAALLVIVAALRNQRGRREG